MTEHRGSGTDTLLSIEARLAASRALIEGQGCMAAVEAAYAIDVPRIRAEERAATLREVEAMYDALAFYATKSNWTARVGGAPAWHDHGHLAREALAARLAEGVEHE